MRFRDAPLSSGDTPQRPDFEREQHRPADVLTCRLADMSSGQRSGCGVLPLILLRGFAPRARSRLPQPSPLLRRAVQAGRSPSVALAHPLFCHEAGLRKSNPAAIWEPPSYPQHAQNRAVFCFNLEKGRMRFLSINNLSAQIFRCICS